jgi:hypothetical protein
MTQIAFENLLRQAVKLGHHKTKKEALAAAVEEYVRRRKAAELVNYFGKVEYYPDYDYKKLRSRGKAK